MNIQPPVNNHLLKALDENSRKAVIFNAEYIHYDLREKISEPNKPIRFVDFPENSVISLLQPINSNELVEIATVGREGMVGVSVLLGVPHMPGLAFCQVPGAAWRFEKDTFLSLIKEYDQFQSICERYIVSLIDQISRNTACNRNHSTEQRSARWLLMTNDRCGSDEFTLTQEFLSAMLGVSRTGVNSAATTFSRGKLISYVRGKIKILNRSGLENYACACYAEVRQFSDDIINQKF